jgi:TolB protein
MLRPTALALIALLAACGEDLQGPTTVTLGTLEIAVTTSGQSPDSDGYSVSLDAGPGVAVATTGSVTFSNLVAGEHEVRLSGLAPNCAVATANPQPVTVGPELVHLDLEVRCGPPTGTVHVVTATVGLHPDADGYEVTVAGAVQPIGSNASLTLPGVPAGDVVVELTGVATNCRVDADNPRTLPLANGGRAEVSFTVTCLANGEGVLLFTSNRSGSSHLYRIQDDGTGLRDLTPSFEAASGDWSPDGSRIVFSGAGTNGAELFVMSADGSDPKPLGVSGSRPRWSPDGRRILFNAGGMMMLMNPDGTGVAELVEGYSPDWSPDGTQIAFDRIDRSRCVVDLFCPSDVYVIGADGTGLVRVASAANASDELAAPDWSPDGSKIAITRRCCFLGPNETGLYVLGIRGGVPQLVYRGSAGGPLWSPDGSALAFALDRGNGTTDIMVIPAGGGSSTVLAASPGSEYPQAWR